VLTVNDTTLQPSIPEELKLHGDVLFFCLGVADGVTVGTGSLWHGLLEGLTVR